jgi:5-dehydro-2-deoxygluconokinase
MPAATTRPLDVITFGRCSVDLYGQQIGSRLEDVTSFAKSVGGSPTNIAIGAARLGLRTGLLTAVGDEQMGRFVLEQLAREGVSTEGIKVDKERLTALVLLSVENDKTFPLIFYRDNCADMGVTEDDVSEAFITSAGALTVTGTHFSKPGVAAAQKKAMHIAKANGMKVAFDIDYRPNLWGLAGHAAGEARYIASERVSRHLSAILPDCDLIVGTEEEIRAASGKEDVYEALCAIRAVSAAVIVLKRGPMGCVVFEGPIPKSIDDGIIGKGFPIEVYNVLGAGDAFMGGFLRGWLRGEPLQTCATWANACGAFAVSRLLCSPEYPTWIELQTFLKTGSTAHALRKDAALNHIHWATTRRPQSETLMAFAIDHRSQLETMADETGAAHERIAAFKTLAVAAAARVADGRPGYGMLIDEKHGRDALFAASKQPFWIGRPLELPGSRPLQIEHGHDVGSQLIEWPIGHTIKILSFYHPDDPLEMKEDQQRTLLGVYQAARTVGRELLVEIIAGKHGAMADDTIARAVAELYALGIKPDWWKLEPQNSASAWAATAQVIGDHDPYCRGIVLLGLDAPETELAQAFAATAGVAAVKGFAVGRTLFGAAALEWLRGSITDADAIDDMADRFRRLTELWRKSRM